MTAPLRRPVAAALAAWLRAPGSLTTRLAAAWGGVQVTLLAQRRERPRPPERRALGLSPHHPVLVRQVLLHGPQGHCVQARSVCALRAARGAWRAIRGLGSRPLAQLLYQRRDIHRSPLQAERLSPRSPARRALRRAAGPGRGPGAAAVWQRHSVFTRRGQRLWVAEAFDDWACGRRAQRGR